jgi:hypothetical protein
MNYTASEVESAVFFLERGELAPMVRVSAHVPVRDVLGVDRLIKLGAAPYTVIRRGAVVSGYDVRVTRQDVIRDAMAWWIVRHGRYVMRSKAAQAARAARDAELWNPIDYYLSCF